MAMTEKSHVVDIDNDCQRNISGGGGDEGYSSDAGDRSDNKQSSSGEIVGESEKRRGSSASKGSVEMEMEVDLPEVKVHLVKVERDCRICHLSMDMSNHHECGTPIELGCSCKDDLAAAHKKCAEAWFKIKGNKTCEICGSVAHNVTGPVEIETIEQWNEANDAMVAPPTGPPAHAERRSFWLGHRFLNFLLACMVFAFVISWLFHFNVPS